MKGRVRTSDKVYPKVKDVLTLLGGGIFIGGSFLIPGLPLLAKSFLKEQQKKDADEWKRFNTWQLKSVLKRLHQQKIVEVVETMYGYEVRVTQKGKEKILRYDLDTLQLSKESWDKKWRIIIYDVDESKKSIRRAFQKILKKLEFLQLQKSVYLTPYRCEDEIEYLRQIYSIDREVVMLTISGLENEQAYKEYFGL